MAANAISQARKKTLLSAHAVRTLKASLLYVLLALGAIGVCFPFLWMILTSFKNYAEAIASPPTMFPKEWILRLPILGRMIAQYPLVLVVALLWLILAIFPAIKIKPVALGVLYVFVVLGLFFVLGSLSWLGQNALPTLWRNALAGSKVELKPLFTNYSDAWVRAPFAAYFRNSLIMSLLTPLLTVVTTAPAAYAFARLRFPGKDLFFLVYLATMMIPPEVLLIPNFVTVSELGWKNTYAALIVPFIVSVVTIFFLRQFFLSIPNELYDAAIIDGCGHSRFLLSVAIPLARPALVSTGMFNFLSSWNALLWPLLVTDRESMRPVALGLASFSTEAGSQPQLYMAAATFSIVPIIIVFLFVQKQFIEGIARTGIK